ncbi:MAG: ABC transporter ATP-binding protein C-terminal domain-containing protein, partial [Caldimonas sp.]
LVADGEPEAVIASPIVQEAYLGLTPEASLTAQDGTTPIPTFPLEGARP